MIKTVEEEIERQKKCLKDKTCKKEVRKAESDGKSTFLRPMPGAARMYPETDLRLIKISRELINEAKENLPKLASENRGYLEKFGLNENLVRDLLERIKLKNLNF
jgi:glutamyl-tRNA(Gln) amidotransferase subunit E